MFSSKKQPSELERLVKRATDETLTSDNWQYILEVCDKISLDPEEGTEEAINLISQRLLLKDANIVLRSLSLLVAMAENCGSRMRQRIASKTFVNDVLLKRLSDKKLHRTLKIRIAEVIEQLHQSFKDDPSLKPMTYGFQEVSKNYPQYLSQGKAGAVPNIPAKEEISQADKIREEEELQRVLKLSLNEYERELTLKKTATVDKPLPEVKNATSNSVSNKEQKDDNTKNIANVSRVRALYDLISYEPDELSFRKGDTITVIESVYRDWWRGALPNGKIGIFPLNYVTPIVSKSDLELNQEWQEEEELLTGHLRKIDYLLALLSSNLESANEDEITSLYNEIIPLRPSLGKAIDKYSVRKEELAILNHQLNAESRLYNELADKLISLRVNRNSSNPYAPPYPTDVGGANYRSNKGQFPSQHRTGGTGGPPAPGIPNFDNTSAPSYTNYDYSSRPSYYTNESGVIREQNTSTGFGNDNIIGNYPQASQPIYGRNDPGYPGYIGSRSNSYVSSDHYLNVNKFPDVNDL